MTRVGALDCGTNSLRLLVADVTDDGLVDIAREVRVVRLGEGVDATGELAPAALERTRAALHDYAATMTDLGVERVRMVATSATRDATNRDAFVAMVLAELGRDPEVVSGVEEAELALAGAVSSLPPGAGRPVLLADIGGGSTELIRSDGGGGPGDLGDLVRAHSMDVGSVRLTERHLHATPPTAAQLAAAGADVREALEVARAQVPFDGAPRLVGVAATVITVAAVALGRTTYAHGALNGVAVPAELVVGTTQRLAAMTREELTAHPVIAPGRADVIVAGALILRAVLEAVGAEEIVVAEHDILDGIALGLA